VNKGEMLAFMTASFTKTKLCVRFQMAVFIFTELLCA
jgi:hypothetical protein